MLTKLKDLANETLTQRLTIIAAITAALHLVVQLHWLTVAQSGSVIKDVTSGIDVLGFLVGAAVSRNVANVKTVVSGDLSSALADAEKVFKSLDG